MNIDMSFVYWASIAEKFEIFGVLGFVFGTVAIFVLAGFKISFYLVGGFPHFKEIEKYLFKAIILCAIPTITYIFMPSEEVIYAMGTAKNVVNNQEYVGDAVNSMIDKIVDAAATIKEDEG